MKKLRKHTKLLLALILSASLCGTATTQEFEQLLQEVDVENILLQARQEGFIKNYITSLFQDFKSGEPFAMQGALAFSSRSYQAFGAANRQNPFAATVNANVNISVYDKLNIPISALVSNQSTRSHYPSWRLVRGLIDGKLEEARHRLVRFGASPSYKWIRLHGGHRSMTFSEFTLSQLNFLGGGMELTPGRLRLAAVYGRLAKARPLNLSLNTPNAPSYQRTGYGIKAGCALGKVDPVTGAANDFIDLILFSGRDKPNSILPPADGFDKVLPQENQVLGVFLKRTLFEKVKLELEAASSAFVPNAREAVIPGASFPHPDFLFSHRQTAQYRSAVRGKVDFFGDGFSLGLNYNRVEPDFKSFGAFYFDTDSEEIAASASLALFKNKVLVNASGGVEQRNLFGTSPTTDGRAIYSASLAYAAGAFNLGLGYSNNSNRVTYLISDGLDSLIALIVTRDANFNGSYTIIDRSENQHAINLSGSFQKVTDNFDDPVVQGGTQLFIGNLIYSLTLSNGAWNIAPRFNFTQNELRGSRVNRYGAGCGVKKALLRNHLSATLDVSYFTLSLGDKNTTETIAARLGSALEIKKSQSIILNVGVLNNTNKGFPPRKKFSELVVGLGYSYTFLAGAAKSRKR